MRSGKTKIIGEPDLFIYKKFPDMLGLSKYDDQIFLLLYCIIIAKMLKYLP